MIQIALYQPEIPPNTGNIIRLSANIGARLHLIHPLGFSLDDKHLRRAGLDYHDLAHVQQHADWEAFLQTVRAGQTSRLFACTTRGQRNHSDVDWQADDLMLFGPETRGLPQTLLDTLTIEQRIRVPMVAGNRSLNLSNAVAVIAYEAWRQLGFAGAAQI